MCLCTTGHACGPACRLPRTTKPACACSIHSTPLCPSPDRHHHQLASMRLGPVLLLLGAAAVGSARGASLASQIGTIPAFLALQHKWFAGPALAAPEADELVQLGQQIHAAHPPDLAILVGSTPAGQEFAQSLLQGTLPAHLGLDADVQRRTAVSHESGAGITDPERVGQVPAFINMYQVAAQPSAVQADIIQLVQLGRKMLDEDYTAGDLRVLLGTDATGTHMLSTILAAHNTQTSPKRATRHSRSRNTRPIQPVFSRL